MSLRRIFLLSFFLPASAFASDGPMDGRTLYSLAAQADSIAVGTVMEVDEDAAGRWAHVAVDTVVAGQADDLLTLYTDRQDPEGALLRPGQVVLMHVVQDGQSVTCLPGGCLVLAPEEAETVAALAVSYQAALTGDVAGLTSHLQELAEAPLANPLFLSHALTDLELMDVDTDWLLARLGPDNEPRVQAWAATQAATLGMKEAIPAVKALLSAPEVPVRQAALLALPKLDTKLADQALRAALSDGSAAVRMTAISGLRTMAPTDLGAVLLSAISAEPDMMVQMELVETLFASPALRASQQAVLGLPLHSIARDYASRRLNK